MPSAMLCCVQNWRKNDTQIFSKTAFKSTPNLDRFCTQLGSILGKFLDPKMESNSLQIASKINLQIDHLMDSVSDRSWDRFYPILSPNLEPKTAQDPPSWSQDAPKTLQIGAKIGPKPITFNQHDPKYPQSRPWTPPWTSFSLIFDRFLMDFWYYFHWLLLDLLLIFDPILIDAFMFLIGFWSPTCFIFSSTTRNPNNSSKYFKNAAYDNPLCRMSHRSPKARAGDDPPQASSIHR